VSRRFGLAGAPRFFRECLKIGLKAPHSMVYRPDLKKPFVVDRDFGEAKIYETASDRVICVIPRTLTD
jgi:hypothetical protein